LVGTPLCLDCYDYPGHVLFSWHVPELWHRYTITLRREIRRHLRACGADAEGVRLSYVKIVELQRRGLPHIHAVLRLDPLHDSACVLTCADLARLAVRAADAVQLRVPDGSGGECVVRFGEQIDTQPLDLNAARGRAVAGYLAKYVTKSVQDLGLSTRRLSPRAIDRLDVSEHVRRVLHALVALAHEPGNAEMLRWLHTLGYRGHVTSNTRHYSTTMTALRARRASWHTSDIDATTDDERVWTYAGSGHRNAGDRLLATSAAHRAIEQQQAAHEARHMDEGDAA
jgi:hypothetical protein